MRVVIRALGLLVIIAGGLVIFFHYTGPTKKEGDFIQAMKYIREQKKIPDHIYTSVPAEGMLGIKWAEEQYLNYGAIIIAIGLFFLILTYIIPRKTDGQGNDLEKQARSP